MARDNAVITRAIDPGILSRVASGDITLPAKHGPASRVIGNVDPATWFGPLQPLAPVAQETKARRWDYMPGYNINIIPRQWEPIQFPQLRALADSYDLLRLLIETRKDQATRMKWRIKTRDIPGQDPKEKKDRLEKAKPSIEALMRRFEYPDQEHDFNQWYRMLLEEMVVIDAAAVFPRRDMKGSIYGYEVISGDTILPLIDAYGRTPTPPDPAYQQILHGIMASDMTRDELVYRPRNRRAKSPYGLGAVEQIICSVNIALRRQISQLEYYKEGSVPEAICSIPKEWSNDQIKDYQMYWDELLSGNLAERRHVRFVPDGFDFHELKTNPLKDEYDEWLARICCFAFSISPTPFVKQVNRNTAESQKEAAQEEGLEPIMDWTVRLMNFLIWKYEGQQDLVFAFEEEDETDPETQATIFDMKVKNGTMTIDEARQRDGLDPYENGLGAKPLIYTGQGAVLLEGIVNPVEPEPPIIDPQIPPEEGGGSNAPPKVDDKTPPSSPPPAKGKAVKGKEKIAKGISLDVEHAAHEAATSPLNDEPQPTDAEIAAGNYKKGHIQLHGLDISIENPKGSTRSGTDKDGNKWESTLTAHYGYIVRVYDENTDGGEQQ